MRNIIQRLADPRNVWEIKIFVLYIFLIFIFAFIYYSLYKRCRKNFLFNAEMLMHQKTIVLENINLRLQNVEMQIRLLEEAREQIRVTGIHQFTMDVLSIPLEYGKVVLVREPIPMLEPTLKDDPVDTVTSITAYSLDDTAIKSARIGHWNDAKPSNLIADVLDIVTKEKQSIDEHLSRVTTDAPDVWSFWDFVYFSTVTQTTVGYGDILPNSTDVRKWVCIQIILGYVLLVVVLNLVFSSR